MLLAHESRDILNETQQGSKCNSIDPENEKAQEEYSTK